MQKKINPIAPLAPIAPEAPEEPKTDELTADGPVDESLELPLVGDELDEPIEETKEEV